MKRPESKIFFGHYFKVLPRAHQSKVAVCKVFALVSQERHLEGQRYKEKCLIFLESVRFLFFFSLPLVFRNMIRAALKTKETGAILTTHYMEEAEAVCDRVAIMVSGQLRWVTARSAHGSAGKRCMWQHGLLFRPHLPQPITMGFMKCSP